MWDGRRYVLSISAEASARTLQRKARRRWWPLHRNGKLYGADIKKAARSTQATQWLKDPLVLGAWSSAAPGAQGARRILMEPLRDKIWFAGEAVHETAFGTVNGAWESGERAAEAALRKMGALKDKEEPKRPQKREQQRGSRRRRN
jgi:monoamine oxidase